MDKRRRLRARGAVMVEYSLLLTTVGIMFLMGITAAGKTLLKQYQDGTGAGESMANAATSGEEAPF